MSTEPLRPRARLSRRQREKVRELAREKWIECDGDDDAARVAVQAELRNGYGSIIGSILIGLAIKLAFELIKLWWANRTTDPGTEFVTGEPGASDDE